MDINVLISPSVISNYLLNSKWSFIEYRDSLMPRDWTGAKWNALYPLLIYWSRYMHQFINLPNCLGSKVTIVKELMFILFYKIGSTNILWTGPKYSTLASS